MAMFPIPPLTAPVITTGKVTTPAAGATIVVTGTLNAGLWYAEITLYIDGTPVPATDDDNFVINGHGVGCPSNGNPVKKCVYLFLTGSTPITVQAGGAGTAGAVYHADIIATQFGEDQQ